MTFSWSDWEALKNTLNEPDSYRTLGPDYSTPTFLDSSNVIPNPTRTTWPQVGTPTIIGGVQAPLAPPPPPGYPKMGLPPMLPGSPSGTAPTSIFDPSTLSAKDLEEQFNALRDPEATSRNLMRRMGLNMNNPFAARTGSTLAQLARISNLSQQIRGQFGTAADQGSEANLRNILNSLITQATSGNFLQYPNWNAPAGAAGVGTAQGLIGELNAMLRQAATKPENLNTMQTGLASRFQPNAEGEYNTSEILGLLNALGGSPTNPFGNFLMKQGLSRQMQDFTDYIGAQDKTKGLLDYLTGSMR